MGRIEKLKREAINEANIRVLKEEDKEQNLWDEFKSWWDEFKSWWDEEDWNEEQRDLYEEYGEEIIRWMEEKLSAHSSTQRKLTPEEKKDIEKILDDTHDTDGYSAFGINATDQEEIKRRMTYQYFLDLYKAETNTDYIPIKSFKQLIDQKYGR